MKLLALIFFVAYASAHHDDPEGHCRHKMMEPGMEYEYEYHGRLLTGLPSLSSQYSGVGMRATVKIFAKSDAVRVLKVEQPTYVDVNQVLYPKERGADISYKNDGWDWKNLYLPTLKPVPAEHAQILANPVEFVVACDGSVRQVTVSRQEPEWSLNFKKALVVLFQSTVDTYSMELEQNRIQHPSEERRVAWQVKEDSLQGRCENTYQVNELPEYLIAEKPELIPLPSKCPTNPTARKYFEIVQTRDLNSCERSTQFNFFKPGNNQNERPSKMSVTRYIVCAAVTPTNLGASASGMAKALRSSDMVLQRVVNVHEQSENMMGFNSERFVSGTRQLLMLRKIQQAQNSPVVPQPIKLNNLMYEHYKFQAPLPTGQFGGGSNGGANGMTGEFLAKISPRGGMNGGVENSSMSVDQTIVQIKKLLKEVVEAILESEKSGYSEEANKSNINLKLMSVVRGFWRVQYSRQLTQVLEEMERAAPSQQYKQTLRNYFVDTLGMAGTPASVGAITQLIEIGRLSQFQIANFFLWMPHNIVFPQVRLLEQIHRIVRSSKVQSQTLTRNLAITSFTQLLQQACIAEDRMMSYPTFVVGEFCDANSQIIQNEWLPYLHGSLASTQDSNERNLFLVALGVLQQRQTIRELIPYVTGDLRAQAGVQVTDLNRLMATYALANIGQTQPDMVVPVLMTVFSNPTESTEIRIAAFNTLLRMNPSLAVFQRIAAITHQEERMDSELLKVINIALYSIGNESPTSEMEVQLGSSSLDLINKAKATFHLIRKVNGILPTSATIYTTEFMKKIGLGYNGFLAYVASEASVLPKSMYTEVRYVLDQHSVLGLMMGYRLSRSENLYQKLGETLLKGLKGEEMASIGGINGQSMESKMAGSFVLQCFENAAMFFSTEDLTVEAIGEKIIPYLKNPGLLKQKLGDMQNLYATRTFNLAQMGLIIPSDMGFPINVVFDTPMTFAVSGKVTPSGQAVAPKLEIAGKFIFTGQYIATVGTILPFTKESLLTGVNQHSVINIPGQVDIELNIPTQKLSVMVKPHQQVTTPVNMIHFHRYPFTVAQPITDLTPISEQPKMKQIHSQSPLRTSQAEFGELLGLQLSAKIETESHYADAASLLDIFDMYNYSPLNLATFLWTVPVLSKKSMPSVRRTSVDLIFDPTQSSTKEIGFEVRAGVASKIAGAVSTKYHMVKVGNGAGSTSGGSNSQGGGEFWELLKELSPYELAEKSLGGSATHPRREQKLKQMFDAAPANSDMTGVFLQFAAIIKGNRPRTWTSALSVVAGATNETNGSIEQVWDIQLERASGTPEAPKHICAKGKLTLPILPIWNEQQLHVKPIEVHLNNKISMGVASCNEASVVTTGRASVSEEQKAFSSQSVEAKKCNGGKFGLNCQLASLQARTLDTVEITNTFTKVPQFVMKLEKGLAALAKVYLWPFTSNIQKRNEVVSANSFTTHLKMKFKKRLPAIDVTIIRPKEELVFANARIPYPLSLFTPLKAGQNNFLLANHKSLSRGSDFKCYLKNGIINKFNDQTLKFNETDDCYHVLAKNDGRYLLHYTYFTVMVKPIRESRLHESLQRTRYDTRVEYRTHKTDPATVSITLHFDIYNKLHGRNGIPMATIEQQNGLKKVIAFNGRNPFHQLEGGATLFFVNFDVMSLVIPDIGKIRVQAEDVDISISDRFKGELSGMCGNSNLVMKGRDLKGINTCTFTKPSLEVASHRFQTGSCPQLHDSVKAELEKEETKCQSGHFGNSEFETGNGMSLLQKGNSMSLGVTGGVKTGNLGCLNRGKPCVYRSDCCSGICFHHSLTHPSANCL